MHRQPRSQRAKAVAAGQSDLSGDALSDPFSAILPFSPTFPLRFWDLVLDDVETRLAPYSWEREPPYGLVWIAREVRQRIRESAELRHLCSAYGVDAHFIIAALLAYFRDTSRLRDGARPSRPSPDRRARLRKRLKRSTGTVKRTVTHPAVPFAITVAERLEGKPGRPRLDLSTPEISAQVFGRLLTEYVRERPGSRRHRRLPRYRGWRWFSRLLQDFWGGPSATRPHFTAESLRQQVEHSRLSAAKLRRIRRTVEANCRAIVADHRGYFRLP
jgi:hypothetical protein